jgi:hypothetical protein
MVNIVKQGHKGIDCPDKTKKADQAHVKQQKFDRTQIPGHTEDSCSKKEIDLKAQKKGKSEEKEEVRIFLVATNTTLVLSIPPYLVQL